MAKILESFTGLTEKKGVQVTQPVSTLVLISKNALNNETLYVRIADSGSAGSERVIVPPIPLKHIAPFAGLNAAGNVKDSATKNITFVHLANGNIKLKNNEKLLIDLTGLTSADDYEMFGIAAPQAASYLLNYQFNKLDSGSFSLPVLVGNADYIAIQSTNYTQVSLVSKTGETQEFSKAEMEILDTFNQKIGSIELGADGYYAFKKDVYHLVNLAEQTKITISSAGAADVPYVLLSKIRA